MLALIWKDIMLEARRRETLSSLFVLGVLVLLAFNFAIDVTPENVTKVGPGILWVAIVFSSMLGLGRTFFIEKENGCLAGLLLAPIDRSSIFLAKFTVNLLFMFVFEALLIPVFALFFHVDLVPFLAPLCAVVVAGTIGLAAASSLFALGALGTRARELMLPLLVLPLEIPLLIAAVKATATVMAGQPLSMASGWTNMLIAFDVLFVTAGWLAFDYVSVD
ncbi:MAG: hypothetical protein D6760_00395 [Deltaproteobacteria bacterium]|nr:MAG: hypothetical protein D6760_00395 [Deltaproteobacteria bacterium]